MPNDIIPFGAGSEVPAHLQNLFGDDSNIAPRSTINQLSYRGKVWRRVVDGEETVMTRMEDGEKVPMSIVSVIVLDHNKNRSRSYYEGAYEEGKNQAPTCYSSDGKTPDADVKEPCAATCDTCPNSVKGSKINESGKQSTLCTPFKRIAIVPAGKAVSTHVPLLLRLAQTSIWDKDNEQEAQGWYAWDQYMDMLRARGAKHTAAVVTKIKFDPATAYPKLLFSAGGWASPEEAAAAKQRLASDADVIAKILTGGGSDGVAGKPADAPADDPEVARKAAAAAAIEKAKQDAAAAKAKKEAEAKAAAEAKAKADAEAAAAASSDDGGWGDEEEAAPAPAPVAKPKPAAKTTKPKPEPVQEVLDAEPAAAASSGSAGLDALLEGWDD